jgi:hypothetical protein
MMKEAGRVSTLIVYLLYLMEREKEDEKVTEDKGRHRGAHGTGGWGPCHGRLP